MESLKTNCIPTKNPSHRLTVRISEEELATLKEFARIKRCSMNQGIRLAIGAIAEAVSN